MSLYLDGDYGQEPNLLERILDECAESIERADPEELAAEMRADGEDVETIAARTKQVCLEAVQRYRSNEPTEDSEGQHFIGTEELFRGKP